MKQDVLSQDQGPTVTHLRVSRSPAVRQTLLAAGAGYAIVILFGAAYGVITAVSPHLTTSATTVIAALVAAPAALALVWPHLATLKAFGVEVSLTHATRDPFPAEGIVSGVEVTLAADAALDEPIRLKTDIDIPAMPGVLARLDELREVATKRVLTIDLGAGNQWLSTRLYLLAAIADDFVRVPRLVFTERLPHDGFVGLARPAAVKSALALALPPEVDTAYVRARREAARLAPDERIRHVVTEFFEVVASIERPEGWDGGLSVPWVTSELLDTWMTNAGKVLDARSIMTVGLSYEELVLTVALDSGDRYIALVAATRRLQGSGRPARHPRAGRGGTSAVCRVASVTGQTPSSRVGGRPGRHATGRPTGTHPRRRDRQRAATVAAPGRSGALQAQVELYLPRGETLPRRDDARAVSARVGPAASPMPSADPQR